MREVRWITCRTSSTASWSTPATARPHRSSTRAPARRTATAARSGAADVDDAVAAASAAFDGWHADDAVRSRRARCCASPTRSRHDASRFIDAECRSTGKPKALMAADEIPPARRPDPVLRGRGAHARRASGAGEYMAGHTSFVRREPIGVCAQVSPWNYPLMMAVWKIAPALAAGNTVVLKPAETTPETTVMLAELAAEFLPPGVFNVVCGDRDIGSGARRASRCRALVSVTGSVRAGMEVAASAATDLKRVHLELGGNAPVIVCDDADVEAAAAGIAGAGLLQRGSGLHRGDPRDRDARRLRPVRRRCSWPRPREEGRRRSRRPDADLGPLNSASPARTGRGLRRPRSRRTPRS